MKERSFITMFLLTIVTCGIYGIYFWYMWTEDINTLCEGDGQESPNYIVVLLLSMITCGIYSFVWYYKQANRIFDAAPKYSADVKENGTSILVWIIIFSPIAQYFLISNTNKLVASYNFNNGTQN